MAISTSVHSDAFKFMSFLAGGVDPRTGQYTRTLTLLDVKTNDLQGPGQKVEMNYNPLNTLDTGYGLGWTLRLSQYTPGNNVLALSTGETLKVTGTSGNQLVMKEKKLDSFHFFRIDDEHFRVDHKSGVVEFLKVHGSGVNRIALPEKIYAPEGHSITLEHTHFRDSHYILKSIKDDSDRTLLAVKRDNSSVDIQLYPFDGPGGDPLARFVMTLMGPDKYVSKITLPTENGASWRFGYWVSPIDHQLYINTVETPTGAREEILYQDRGHQFPLGSGRKPLPRVTHHRIFPDDQPDTLIDVRYTYPEEYNFLGYGLNIAWDDGGLDNLYKHIGAYLYHSVETLYIDDKPVRSIARDFNQFHLQTKETTTQNNHVQTVETTYFLTPDVPFEQQTNYCQLPHEVKTTWAQVENGTTIRQRSETVSSTYDPHGNLLTQTQANGVTEISTWYPAADADDFVRHLKDRTVTPAPSPNGKAPTLCTRYTYKTLRPLNGTRLPKWKTVERETLVQLETSGETELQDTKHEHFDDPDNAFLHGRVSQQTLTMNDKATITEYEYFKVDSPEFEQSVLRTVETVTGFDHEEGKKHVKKEITLEHSLHNGEPSLNRDDNNVEIRYRYDALRRVISETVAPGSEFEATRRYEYLLCANPGDQAEQWMFDVKGVKTCTKFDGLNRAIYEERDDADHPTRAAEPRQIYAATYNPLGQKVEETEYDWLDNDVRVLTSHFDYDDWGEQRCVTGPDGVKTFEETDPIGTVDSKGPIQRSWREGTGPNPMVSGVTETWLNLFEKPVRTERFDLAQKSISLHQYFYDGLGRTHKEIVGFGAVQRVNLYVYDPFDRMIENTLPDAAKVRRSYAPHSSEDLPRSISVNNIELGTQLLDGLGRMTESVTGGRKQTYTFKPGQTQPETVTTPSGQVIEYVYQPQLGTEPVLRRLPRLGVKGEYDEADYKYDEQNARLRVCREQGLQLTREYFSTGELKSEKREGPGGEHTMYYRYSRLGRLLSYTDVLGQEQSYDYDPQGRLIKTQLGTTVSTFDYDSLGQTKSITTYDKISRQIVGITLQHDEFGRETQRCFDLNGVKQTLSQVYDDVDCLTRRTLMEGTDVLRDESYGYDLRGRLTNYECTGRLCPIDPYGKVINKQVFTLDELDNIRLVMTHFDNTFNRARYFYDNPDKVQLSKVTNTHADYPPVINLLYNLDGHLIQDEEQRTLKYDALGRLISVSEPSGGASKSNSYIYTPLDNIAGNDDGSGQAQRFYQGDQLANQVKGADSRTFMWGDKTALAELWAGDVPKS
ncbi:sugar-binding protein [Pseudomonas sp. SDO5532_S415]